MTQTGSLYGCSPSGQVALANQSLSVNCQPPEMCYTLTSTEYNEAQKPEGKIVQVISLDLISIDTKEKKNTIAYLLRLAISLSGTILIHCSICI